MRRWLLWLLLPLLLLWLLWLLLPLLLCGRRVHGSQSCRARRCPSSCCGILPGLLLLLLLMAILLLLLSELLLLLAILLAIRLLLLTVLLCRHNHRLLLQRRRGGLVQAPTWLQRASQGIMPLLLLLGQKRLLLLRGSKLRGLLRLLLLLLGCELLWLLLRGGLPLRHHGQPKCVPELRHLGRELEE